jgi:hypothetical protein
MLPSDYLSDLIFLLVTMRTQAIDDGHRHTTHVYKTKVGSRAIFYYHMIIYGIL